MDEFTQTILKEINRVTRLFRLHRIIRNPDGTHTLEIFWIHEEAQAYCESLEKILGIHQKTIF